jgi:hypothetical protein
MEPNPPPEEMETPRRRRRGGKKRYLHGRAWVAGLWLVLRLGDLPLAWLAFRSFNPAPQWRLPLFVAILWTTALFIALWAKQIWARYITAIFLGIYVCWWAIDATALGVIVAKGEVVIRTERLATLVIAMLTYLVVAIVVLRSKQIRYLTDPTAGWKQ